MRSTSEGSRINLALLNRQLASTLRSFQTLQETGIPTHDPILLELEIEHCQQAGHTIQTPMAFPLDWQDPVADAEAYQAEHLSTALLEEANPAWEEALQSRDTNKMYSLFSDVAEAYIGHRAFGCQAPPRYLGRGKRVTTSKRQMTSPHQDNTQGALEIKEVQMIKLARRVEELIRKLTLRQTIAPLTADTHDLWARCRQQGFQLLPDWGA